MKKRKKEAKEEKKTKEKEEEEEETKGEAVKGLLELVAQEKEVPQQLQHGGRCWLCDSAHSRHPGEQQKLAGKKLRSPGDTQRGAGPKR